MNDWFASLNLAPWIPVAGAYLFGIATGWLLWGGRSVPIANGDTNGHLTGDDEHDDRSEPITNSTTKTEPPVENKDMAKAMFSAGKTKHDNKTHDPAPNSMKLGALESELRKAQEMLVEAEQDSEGHAKHLDDLEGALKRANGRLKLIMKAIKKSKPET